MKMAAAMRAVSQVGTAVPAKAVILGDNTPRASEAAQW